MVKSNFDAELAKALRLMEEKTPWDKKPVNEANNVIFYRMGADNKVYGILQEGTKYVIKTTEPGKERMAESYEYLDSVNHTVGSYKSCNVAEKQLQLTLMSLNESYGKALPTNVVDFGKSQKVLENLTEEARAAIDRTNQIFENSFINDKNIGNHGDAESKGTSKGSDTIKNNEPFEVKADASLDKDPKFSATVKGATPDNKEVAAGVEKDLESDKMKTANSDSEKDYKDTKDDLEGDSLAAAKGKTNKGKVNEGLEELDGMSVAPVDGEVSMGDDMPEIGGEMPEVDGEMSEVDGEMSEVDGEMPVGIPDIEDTDESLEEMIREFEEEFGNGEVMEEEKDAITGPDKVLDGPHGTDGKDADWERVGKSADVNGVVKEGEGCCKEGECDCSESLEQGSEETMKSYKSKGNLPVQAWDKMDKSSLDEMVDKIYDRLMEKVSPKKKVVKESLSQMIDRIVKEEVTKLDAWGKHPRYGKEPMTLPANKEVLAGTAEKDWNDDSTKGNVQYGKKIGDSAPYEKIINIITDQVMANLKESLRRK